MSESLSDGRRACLLVSCHPLSDSLCHHLVDRVRRNFADHPVEIEHLDLYKSEFAAPLSAAERRSYFTDDFDAAGLGAQIAALRRAEILVMVFPTWWFGPPALLKGWFDRVWAPGIAFGHPAVAGGRITPRLNLLRHCLVVTTLGSPWWFDRLILRRPLRRILKKGLVGACAPGARFDMLSLYGAMALDPPRVTRFLRRIDEAVLRIIRSAPPSRSRAEP